jgi:hypothetical protein
MLEEVEGEGDGQRQEDIGKYPRNESFNSAIRGCLSGPARQEPHEGDSLFTSGTTPRTGISRCCSMLLGWKIRWS